MINARVAPRPDNQGSGKIKPYKDKGSRIKKTSLMTRYKWTYAILIIIFFTVIYKT